MSASSMKTSLTNCRRIVFDRKEVCLRGRSAMPRAPSGLFGQNQITRSFVATNRHIHSFWRWLFGPREGITGDPVSLIRYHQGFRTMKPTQTPKNPCFSSGPCAKHPGWSLDALKKAAVGRSHRAKIGKTKLAEVIDRSRKLLGMPADYVLGIVPASDTGAVEMAMWSMLGQRGV